MNVFYQFVVPGIGAVIVGALTFWAAVKKIRADIEIKKLDNANARDEREHDELRATTVKWMECVEARANCEAERSTLTKENASLVLQLAEFKTKYDKMQEELRNAQQRLAYVDFFNEQGQFKPHEILNFAQRLIDAGPDVPMLEGPK